MKWSLARSSLGSKCDLSEGTLVDFDGASTTASTLLVEKDEKYGLDVLDGKLHISCYGAKSQIDGDNMLTIAQEKLDSGPTPLMLSLLAPQGVDTRARCARCIEVYPTLTLEDGVPTCEEVIRHVESFTCNTCRWVLVEKMLRSDGFLDGCISILAYARSEGNASMVDFILGKPLSRPIGATRYIVALCRLHHRLRNFLAKQGAAEGLTALLRRLHLLRSSHASTLEYMHHVQVALSCFTLDFNDRMLGVLFFIDQTQRPCRACCSVREVQELLSAGIPTPEQCALGLSRYCGTCQSQIAEPVRKSTELQHIIRSNLIHNSSSRDSAIAALHILGLVCLDQPKMRDLLNNTWIVRIVTDMPINGSDGEGHPTLDLIEMTRIAMADFSRLSDESVAESLWTKARTSRHPLIRNTALRLLAQLHTIVCRDLTKRCLQQPPSNSTAASPWEICFLPTMRAVTDFTEVDTILSTCMSNICSDYCSHRAKLAAVMHDPVFREIQCFANNTTIYDSLATQMASVTDDVFSPYYTVYREFWRQIWPRSCSIYRLQRVIPKAELIKICKRAIRLYMKAQCTVNDICLLAQEDLECRDELLAQLYQQTNVGTRSEPDLYASLSQMNSRWRLIGLHEQSTHHLNCTHIVRGWRWNVPVRLETQAMVINHENSHFLRARQSLLSLRSWLRWVPVSELPSSIYHPIPLIARNDIAKRYIGSQLVFKKGKEVAFSVDNDYKNTDFEELMTGEPEHHLHVLCVKTMGRTRPEDAPVYWEISDGVIEQAFTGEMTSRDFGDELRECC